MDAEAADLATDAGFEAVFKNDVAIDRCRIEVPVKATCPVVFYRSEQSSFDIATMSRKRKIVFNHALGTDMHRDEADFRALALDAKMHHALPAVQVFHAQGAELF